MDSILNLIKKSLYITEACEDFDPIIIMHINNALHDLNQIWPLNKKGFVITDETATWFDLLDDNKDLESVKAYIWAKVKLRFDPPQSSTHIKALEDTIKEIEWRLTIIDKEGEE